jgi:hypothetical protein
MYVSIFAILLVLLSGMPVLSGGSITTNYASARYANTQTQANANDCNTGTNCAINSPQTQGDGSASSHTNLQISKSTGEELPAIPRSQLYELSSCVETFDGGELSTLRCEFTSLPPPSVTGLLLCAKFDAATYDRCTLVLDLSTGRPITFPVRCEPISGPPFPETIRSVPPLPD